MILLLFAALIYQCWNHWRIRSALLSLPDQSDAQNATIPISWIIAARNEQVNLRQNLGHWLAQQYPAFELILVDDRSTDGSGEWLDARAAEHDGLRVLHVAGPPHGAGKKHAITLGIQSARYEHMVFCDADCLPSDPQWLARYAGAFEQGSSLVLGLGLFRETEGWVNALYRLDALRIASMYTAFAAFGQPYMGVGRSMGYAKSLFQTVGGFRSHEDVASGDDDLLVQEAQQHYSATACPAALTWSDAPKTVIEWLRQRKRHLQAGHRYAKNIKNQLILIEVSAFISAAGLFIVPFTGQFKAVILYFLCYLIRLLIVQDTMRILSQKGRFQAGGTKLFWFELVLSILNPLLSVTSQLIPAKEWRIKT